MGGEMSRERGRGLGEVTWAWGPPQVSTVSLLGSGHRGTRIGAPVVRLRGRREVVQAEARGEVSGPP